MLDLEKIIAFEEGSLDNEGTLDLFSGLIASGMAWQLQGMYGRFARDLIEGGVINRDGTINKSKVLSKEEQS